jgi:hypothetical protein
MAGIINLRMSRAITSPIFFVSLVSTVKIALMVHKLISCFSDSFANVRPSGEVYGHS